MLNKTKKKVLLHAESYNLHIMIVMDNILNMKLISSQGKKMPDYLILKSMPDEGNMFLHFYRAVLRCIYHVIEVY